MVHITFWWEPYWRPVVPTPKEVAKIVILKTKVFSSILVFMFLNWIPFKHIQLVYKDLEFLWLDQLKHWVVSLRNRLNRRSLGTTFLYNIPHICLVYHIFVWYTTLLCGIPHFCVVYTTFLNGIPHFLHGVNVTFL